MSLKLTNILKEYSTGIVNKLKQNFKHQNSALTDQQMDYYINRFDQLKSSPKVEQKDITKYSFQQLEQIVDSFPTKDKVKKQVGENNVEFSQTELIYNQSPLQIFHGDSERTCIKIKGDFPATWCVSRSSGGNMYKNYRYQGQEPSFYFVKNLDRMNKIQELSDDPYCFFVVQYNNEGGYVVTSALNDDDNEMSWENVVKLEPLLQGKESLFKHVPLTDDEKKYYERFRNGISDEEYKNLSYEEKKIYISITNELRNEKFKLTPKDLINDYITTGVELTDEQFDFIKDKKQLLDNYRRVTINTVIPEYLKGNIYNIHSRWKVLTDEEAIDLYEKKQIQISKILMYKPSLIKYFEDDIKRIRIIDVVEILEEQPSLIKYFEDRFFKFRNDDITNILSSQPSLIKYFEDRLIELDTINIRKILINQPQFLKYFENRLDEFTKYDVSFMLMYQPQFLKYFENIKYYLDADDITNILISQPSLIKYFEDRLSELSDYDVKTILRDEPSLKPYFEKHGLIKENLKYPPLRNILKK